MTRIVLGVLVVCVTAFAARAEDLPRFDIRAHCIAKAAERGGVAPCQRAEEAQRGAISRRWSSYPKQRKHFCVQSVTFRGKLERSYVDLGSCLGDESSTS